MLWFCEQHIAADPIWEDVNLFCSVDQLVKELEMCFDRHLLSHYFIPEYNLIKDIPSESVSQAKQRVQTIRGDIREWFRFNLALLLEFVSDARLKLSLATFQLGV